MSTIRSDCRIWLAGSLLLFQFAVADEVPERASGNFYLGVDQKQLQHILNMAALKNDPLTIIEVCEAGADPNTPGDGDVTPLQISARLGNVEALETLLEHGGIADGKSMISAALAGQMKAMKLLERYGGDIAETDGDGCSTLHYIAGAGSVEMVRYLVEHGVPVNGNCREDETPLTWAKSKKNTEVIRYLEQIGAR